MTSSRKKNYLSCKIPRNIEALYSLIWKMTKKEREYLLLQFEDKEKSKLTRDIYISKKYRKLIS
tara:strand:+ start:80 stop:271 length:192 start_codon:yes stop_codon:yes gene_type:complete